MGVLLGELIIQYLDRFKTHEILPIFFLFLGASSFWGSFHTPPSRVCAPLHETLIADG